MKKNVRNALAISGLALAIGASGLTLTASANTAGNGRGQHLERQQNPSKIARVKTTEAIKNVAHRRTIPGVVSAISTDSISIVKGNKTYNVTISATTRVLNRKWQSIALSDVKTGDKVRIFGIVFGTNVTAQTVRDISVPTPATK